MNDDSCHPTSVTAKIGGHVWSIETGPYDEEGWSLSTDEILKRWFTPVIWALKAKIAQQAAAEQAAQAAQQQEAAQ